MIWRIAEMREKLAAFRGCRLAGLKD